MLFLNGFDGQWRRRRRLALRPLFFVLVSGVLLSNSVGVGAIAASAQDLASADPSMVRFDSPVECTVNPQTPGACVIQQYVDLDPGPGRLDHGCGRLSYDGATGTDFRTPTLADMRVGVAVLAAAGGVVEAVRDGMADVSVRDIGFDAVAGREAGNGVVIRHNQDWVTQYSHLKKGSVQVRPGDRVARGAVIGSIGLSGRTEFPHVEFTVRHRGEPVDPFVGIPVGVSIEDAPSSATKKRGCEGRRAPLWTPAALAQFEYVPTGILAMGVAEGAATAQRARVGRYDRLTITTKSPAIVIWVDSYGTEENDRQHFTLRAPGGRLIYDTSSVLEKNNISWFAFAGRRAPAGGWVPGAYEARYTLTRDGQSVASRTFTFHIK
ncbi:MAG: M23 family metallopeptidase [Pseudomonadota bacterium]